MYVLEQGSFGGGKCLNLIIVQAKILDGTE